MNGPKKFSIHFCQKMHRASLRGLEAVRPYEAAQLRLRSSKSEAAWPKLNFIKTCSGQ